MVVVVDDDATVTVVLTRILDAAGWAVRVCDSGEDLLGSLPLVDCDVICLDMGLPGIDGLETLARLIQAGVRTPVILFTASAGDVRDQALAAGAFACVSKTGGWSELRAAVDAAITRGTATEN
jgi:DNA-binding response OmpR family regulator